MAIKGDRAEELENDAREIIGEIKDMVGFTGNNNNSFFEAFKDIFGYAV